MPSFWMQSIYNTQKQATGGGSCMIVVVIPIHLSNRGESTWQPADPPLSDSSDLLRLDIYISSHFRRAVPGYNASVDSEVWQLRVFDLGQPFTARFVHTWSCWRADDLAIRFQTSSISNLNWRGDLFSQARNSVLVSCSAIFKLCTITKLIHVFYIMSKPSIGLLTGI